MRKLFVVSDIHGHYTLLKAALDEKGFDENNNDHVLVCCGDYFDRGSENLQVLKFFERLKNKVLLRGNHEDLLMKVLDQGRLQPHNYINGTLQTITEFFGNNVIDPVDDSLDLSGKSRTVDRIVEFIEGTADYFETEGHVFVHGWVCGDTREKRQAASKEAWERARWVKWTEKYDGERPLKDKILVCGHMPTLMARLIDPSRPMGCADIFYGNGIIAIDAGTYDSKQVNVLVIEE